MRYQGVNLNIKVSEEETSKLVQILEDLPLLVEGMTDKNFLTKDKNPAYLEILKDESDELSTNTFILQPAEGFKIMYHWIFSWLSKGKSTILSSNPSRTKDQRHFFELNFHFGNDNYIFKMYSLPESKK